MTNRVRAVFTGWNVLWMAILTIVLALGFVGSYGSYTIAWDGGFPATAFDFKFIDDAGRPTEGVTLSVDPVNGASRHHLPIDDSYPGRVPTSGKNGEVRFHCSGRVFGGTCHHSFFFMTSGKCESPKYMLRFSLGEKELLRVIFNSLVFSDDFWSLPKIKRSLALPSFDQRSSESIPPTDQLQEKEYEFHLVQRTVVVTR